TWRFVFPLSHRIKSGNRRRRRFFGRLALPPITGRNRTKTGNFHNPGFARLPPRAIVNAFRCALVSRAQRSTSRAVTPVFAGYGDALQTRDRFGPWRSRISDAPLHFVTRCTASGTRDGVGRVRSLIHFSNSPDLLVPAARLR